MPLDEETVDQLGFRRRKMRVCDVGRIWSEGTDLEVRMGGMEKEKGLRVEEGKKS